MAPVTRLTRVLSPFVDFAFLAAAFAFLAAAFAFLAAGCAPFAPPDRSHEITAALEDLRAAGFAFEPDVRFQRDRYAVCSGLSCADVVVRGGHRTIVIASEAFHSPDRVRATLLEIWERYREPRPGSVPDLARAALRVVRDGPKAGVESPATLRRAHRAYRDLYEQLDESARRDLPEPDRIPAPPR